MENKQDLTDKDIEFIIYILKSYTKIFENSVHALKCKEIIKKLEVKGNAN